MADGNATSNTEPKYPRNILVDEMCPSDTLRNCCDVVQFLGIRLSSWTSAGVDFNDKDGNAVSLILFSLEAALKFEADRVQYRRKSEAEVAAEAKKLKEMVNG